MVEMLSILSGYDINKIDAARAAAMKHGSDLDPKTLTNAFASDPIFTNLLGKLEPPQDEKTRANYYRSFPAKARKLLRKRRI